MALFADRSEAGKKLAEKLAKYKKSKPLVLALPRGGVAVGYEVAKKLDAQLDVLVVRKLGAPMQPEFAIGAIAPGGVKILDEEAIQRLGIFEDELREIEQHEQKELQRRLAEYRDKNSPSVGEAGVPDVRGKTVILVDDGLATGITARAAVEAILAQNPKKLIVAAPVCSVSAQESLGWVIREGRDEIVCLSTPADFTAIGTWYKNFDQVSDRDVMELLEKARKED